MGIKHCDRLTRWLKMKQRYYDICIFGRNIKPQTDIAVLNSCAGDKIVGISFCLMDKNTNNPQLRWPIA